jgi:hypothetical protein
MNVAELLVELDQLAKDAEAFATAEPAFVAKLTATLAEVKALLPSGTVAGLLSGLKADVAKVEDIFKKK